MPLQERQRDLARLASRTETLLMNELCSRLPGLLIHYKSAHSTFKFLLPPLLRLRVITQLQLSNNTLNSEHSNSNAFTLLMKRTPLSWDHCDGFHVQRLQMLPLTP